MKILRGIQRPQTQPTDEQLFRKYGAGDEGAFSELFARYKNSLYTFCVRMTGTRDRAGDAFQETFFRVIKYRRSFESERAFKPWLFAIARNACRQIISSDRMFMQLDDAAEEDVAAEEAGLDFTEKETIAEAIAQLPPGMREAIVLYEYEGFTYQEISEITNAGISLVKVRIHRARNALRAILQPVFGDERKKLR